MIGDYAGVIGVGVWMGQSPAMISLSVKTDFTAVELMLKSYSSQIRDKVLAPALNKVGAKAKTEMSRQIRKEYALGTADVDPLLVLKRANAAHLTVELRATHKRKSFNVIRFLPVTLRNIQAQARGKQLRFMIRRGRRVQITGAFVGAQGRTVFMRVGRERLPIKAVQTIDVAQMFNARKVNDVVVRKIRQELPIEVERAIRSGRFV